MEAELGEMDAEGRSDRPPYAPGKKRRAKLRTREASRIGLPGPPPHRPACPVWTAGSVSSNAGTPGVFHQWGLCYISFDA